MRAGSFLFVAGCLLGAAGVAAAASASHSGGDTSMAAAAQILLAHGPAVLAIALAGALARDGSRLLLVAGWVMIAGAVVFSADMAARRFFGHPLFPMAAPIGGSALIAAWLLAAAGFLIRRT